MIQFSVGGYCWIFTSPLLVNSYYWYLLPVNRSSRVLCHWLWCYWIFHAGLKRFVITDLIENTLIFNDLQNIYKIALYKPWLFVPFFFLFSFLGNTVGETSSKNAWTWKSNEKQSKQGRQGNTETSFIIYISVTAWSFKAQCCWYFVFQTIAELEQQVRELREEVW